MNSTNNNPNPILEQRVVSALADNTSDAHTLAALVAETEQGISERPAAAE